ncbi:unnamed protein product [Ilex paraguariensis]|uniref:Uncharacterized protein n=1 Tax=Ilex paraguariensis TaxID=185542 RepID=A0ABC8RCM8_9AQUA
MPNSRILRSPSGIKDVLLVLSTISILYLLLHHHHHHHLQHPIFTHLLRKPPTPSSTPTSPLSLHHILFSIASSSSSLPRRLPYLLLWSHPNTTLTYLFLDSPTTNHTPFPTIISSPTTHFPYTFRHGLRSAIRVARIVKETLILNLTTQSQIKWYVFGDDDTVFFTDNLLRTLSKYDHNEWYYIGSNSESYEQNEFYSFDMAFGGGGFALSASLARVLARVLDSCLMRYPHLYGSDARVFSCLTELGVGLTHEPGFHQVDVRGDLFGMLSAHPLSPLVSLHHLDGVEPIFPGMNRTQALGHLFKAVTVDPARILQQTVCYDRSNSLTVSVAWGYTVQVFEGNQLLPDLISLQRTFRPWRRSKSVSSHYMFNTRDHPSDPCKRPIVFFLESVVSDTNRVWTDYTKHSSGNCLRTTSIQRLERIRVSSQKLNYDIRQVKAPHRQCCDILPSFNKTMSLESTISEGGLNELLGTWGLLG